MKSVKQSRYVICGIATLVLLLMLAMPQAATDEGMWTFDNLPLEYLKEKYGFTPTQEWLDHVRLSSVRFMDGGSGSFVSSKGLVLTNHHVGVGQLQKISSAEKDYVADGYFARSPEEELPCADLELNVLISMENVTARVLGAVKESMSDEEGLKAREAIVALIAKESEDITGLKAQVVNLYRGGEYWLYLYKKYTDVRLVAAPEKQAAFFGGDADNFTYPRYDLDFAFFRVYENDKPIASDHYLKWSANGAEKDELVFCSGNPGSTDRLFTYKQLELQREFSLPMTLTLIERYIATMKDYSKRGTEEERRALTLLFSLENSQKAYTGRYQGLQDEAILANRRQAEEDFKAKVNVDPALRAEYGDLWNQMDAIMLKATSRAKQNYYRRIIGSQLATHAATIVEYATEIEKPDAERLAGFHDAELEGMKFALFSPAPIYPDQEEAILAGLLQLSQEELGDSDPFIRIVLNGRSPAVVAKELIGGTKLTDIAFRKSLIDGGKAAVEQSADPLIVLARKLSPLAREMDEWQRKNVGSVMAPLQEKIAKARFAVYGKTVYPDATFTLRLSFGPVTGYPYNGTVAPYKTTLYGLYDRAISHDRTGFWSLPDRFWQRKDRLDLSTPVNFVSALDIIGGNSGSPVINRNAELVGLVFDGNIESLPGNYLYDGEKNRCVSVHSSYIIEALTRLYDAEQLAGEILGN